MHSHHALGCCCASPNFLLRGTTASKPGDAYAKIGLLRGRIMAMEIREDGLWGRVAWNEAGANSVCQKESGFISPAFEYLKGGKIIARITSTSLTNAPNLSMGALRRDAKGGSDGRGSKRNPKVVVRGSKNLR